MKKVVIILALVLTSTMTFAQDAPAATPTTPESKFAAAVDIVSPYLWRGIKLTSNKIAFQPYLSYAFTDKVTAGVWGTTNFSSDEKAYNEFDVYVSYQISPIVKLMASSYYYNLSKEYKGYRASYFDFSDSGTQAIDLTVALDFSEKGVPVDFQWNTLVGGNDFNDGGNRNYSSYTEIGYSHSIESAGLDLRLFAGAVVGKSNYYITDGFSFTNVGLNVAKEIKFSEKFSLPVFVRYTYNDNGNPNKDWDDTVKSVVSAGLTLTIK